MKTTTSNVQSPGLPSSFQTGPDKGREEGRKEGKKEGKTDGRRGGKLAGDTLLLFSMFNEK